MTHIERLIRSLILVVICALAFGCGGGGGGTTDDSGGGGGNAGDVLTGPDPITEKLLPASVRHAAMDRVRNKYDELYAAHVSPLDREAQLRDFIQTVAEFRESGLSADGTVWGRFTDGSYYMFNDRDVPDDFVPHETTQPAGSAGIAYSDHGVVASNPERTIGIGAEQFAPASAGLELVNSKKAYVFETFAGSMGTPNQEIAKMLTKRGYEVSSQVATVEALRSVSDAGVFYISSHGAVAFRLGKPSETFWGLWTGTAATPDNDLIYERDLLAARLVIFEAAFAKSLPFFKALERRYAITANFVKFYDWSFSSRSVAFINACWSDSSGFTTALRSLAKPVGTTFGWSNAANPDRAWRAASYIFDRSLGTNMSEPQPGMLRPFPASDVFVKAQSLNITDASTVSYGACNLLMGGTNTLLAPSIKEMEVIERGIEPTSADPIVVIHGDLGTVLPESVKIGGVNVKEVSVVSDSEWRCKVEGKPGPGYSGRVEIVSNKGLKSNSPPITSWQGPFEYRDAMFTIPLPPRGTININGAFRADIHKFRETVDGELKDPAPRYARTALDSKSNWEITGPLSGWTFVRPTSGVLTYGPKNEPTPFGTGYFLDLLIDRAANGVGIAFGFLGCDTKYTTPPLDTEFPLAIGKDPLMTTFEPAGTDLLGGTMYVPKLLANLQPNYSVAKQTFDGLRSDVTGRHFDVPALIPTAPPTNDSEEDVR